MNTGNWTIGGSPILPFRVGTCSIPHAACIVNWYTMVSLYTFGELFLAKVAIFHTLLHGTSVSEMCRGLGSSGFFGEIHVTMLWIVPLQPSTLYHTSRTWLLAKNQQRSWQRFARPSFRSSCSVDAPLDWERSDMMYSKMSKNCCKVYCTWCDVQVRQGGLGDLNIELWLTGRVLFLQQEIACDGDTCLIILGKLFLAKVIHPCV